MAVLSTTPRPCLGLVVPACAGHMAARCGDPEGTVIAQGNAAPRVNDVYHHLHEATPGSMRQFYRDAGVTNQRAGGHPDTVDRVNWASHRAAVRGTSGAQSCGCIYYTGEKKSGIWLLKFWGAFLCACAHHVSKYGSFYHLQSWRKVILGAIAATCRTADFYWIGCISIYSKENVYQQPPAFLTIMHECRLHAVSAPYIGDNP